MSTRRLLALVACLPVLGGSITAALFLKRFVTNTRRWAHFDIYGWSLSERHHSSIGGEAQGIRALFHYIAHQFAK